jgi:tetratricopeptide (TPR) repeat protein
MGCAYLSLHQLDQAVSALREAVRLQPADPSAHYNLGRALLQAGDFNAALPELQFALSRRPDDVEIRGSMGLALAAEGDKLGALTNLVAISSLPASLAGAYQQARLHLAVGAAAEAAIQYRVALRERPDWPEAANDFAWLLASHPDASVRNGVEAVHWAERACLLTANQQPVVLGTLAAAYAEAGRFADAIRTAELAVAVARQSGLQAIADRNEELLRLYRDGKAYHEPASN